MLKKEWHKEHDTAFRTVFRNINNAKKAAYGFKNIGFKTKIHKSKTGKGYLLYLKP